MRCPNTTYKIVRYTWRGHKKAKLFRYHPCSCGLYPEQVGKGERDIPAEIWRGHEDKPEITDLLELISEL